MISATENQCIQTTSKQLLDMLPYHTWVSAVENMVIGVPEDFATIVGKKNKFVDPKLDEPAELDGTQQDVFG